MNGPRTFNFTRDGGTQSFSFSCNRDWSASSTESWVTLSPSSGTTTDGEITVKITCSANNTYDSRSATVTVRTDELSETVTVTQETGIGLIVSPTSFDLTNSAQDIEIEVQKNIQYSIAIDEAGINWIKAGGTKALTRDMITFHIAENKDYDGREGRITFKQTDGPLTATVVIRQSQKNGLFVTTPTYDLSNEAHTLAVEVKSNVEFEVTSQADWIKYVETKGLKASTVTLTIDANESYDNRTGTVLIKQTNGNLEGTIIINQKQTDGLFVTPDSFEVSNQEQSLELTVKENVAYSVVIPDDAKTWVAVKGTNNTKALVEEKIVLAIAKNTTYDDRETSVTIKQNDGPLAETVKIKQAYGEGLIVDKTSYEIDEEGGAIEISVRANVDYSVTSNVNWISVVETKALSSSSFTLNIEANTTTKYREGTVIIMQNNGSLSQTVSVNQLPRPLVTTLEADEILFTSARLIGKVEIEGEDISKLKLNFYYSDKFNTIAELTSMGSVTKAYYNEKGTFVHADFDRLVPSTTYYYVACLDYNGKKYYGDVVSFTTREMSVQITTNEPSSLSLKSAIISANLIVDAQTTPDVCFYYSETVSTAEDLMNSGSVAYCDYGENYSMNLHDYHFERTFSSNLSSLKPGTNYYYVFVATFHHIPNYGDELEYCGNVSSFTTKPIPDGAVDLGLSVVWATCNIGASNPEDAGQYYAWGEITPKTEFTWSNYKWCNGSKSTLTKYNIDPNFGVVDNRTQLELEDDAAHVILGNGWRIPSYYEWVELLKNSTWTWACQNGTYGYIIVSKTNENYIFLPAFSYTKNSESTDPNISGFYPSSTIDIFITDECFRCYGIHFDEKSVSDHPHSRFYGHHIRPVFE